MMHLYNCPSISKSLFHDFIKLPMLIILYMIPCITVLNGQGLSSARNNLHLFDLDDIFTYLTNEKLDVVNAKLLNFGLKQTAYEPDHELHGIQYIGIKTFEQEYSQTIQLDNSSFNGNKRLAYVENSALDRVSLKIKKTTYEVRYEINIMLMNESVANVNKFKAYFLEKYMDNYTLSEEESISNERYQKYVYYNYPPLDPNLRILHQSQLLPFMFSISYNEMSWMYRSLTPFGRVDLEIFWTRPIPRGKSTAELISIPLVKLQNNLHQISISLGGKPYDFILDSGASFLVINNMIESALIKSGHIRPSDYLGSTSIITANGDSLIAKKVKIGILTLGNAFDLYDVEAVILPNAEPLLGKNILNKFSEWKINNALNILDLRK